ncbi:MAG: hypothetical protein AAF362_19365 [Pseudomonadota bacterium]
MARMTIDGRIHAETLVSAIGCVAGYSAQGAVFEQMRAKGIPLAPPAINVISTKNHQTYYFSDQLNLALVSDVNQEMNGIAFWPLVAGGAVASGADLSNIESVESMFSHIASQIGSDDFRLRVGNCGQPQLPPRELLKIVWPLASKCLDGSIFDIASKSGETKVKFWPVISGYVANNYIQQVKHVVDPAIAACICMESAILCSKLPAATLNEPLQGAA